MSRIDYSPLKKLHLPVGQVENRIHQPDNKIHWFRAVRHDFLYKLYHI